MTFRIAFPVLAAVVVAGDVAAQDPVIEQDAPERGIAGCYAVRTFDGLSLFGFDDGTDADTISLTLVPDHAGVVLAGTQISADSITSVPWRESGWKLKVQPSPFGGLHSFAQWSLIAGQLVITGSRGHPYRITASFVSDGSWQGTLIRIRAGVRQPLSSVTLTSSKCPSAEYFRSVSSRVMRRNSGWPSSGPPS